MPGTSVLSQALLWRWRILRKLDLNLSVAQEVEYFFAEKLKMNLTGSIEIVQGGSSYHSKRPHSVSTSGCPSKRIGVCWGQPQECTATKEQY